MFSLKLPAPGPFVGGALYPILSKDDAKRMEWTYPVRSKAAIDVVVATEEPLADVGADIKVVPDGQRHKVRERYIREDMPQKTPLIMDTRGWEARTTTAWSCGDSAWSGKAAWPPIWGSPD